ncbi:ferrous iron transport protein B, partial [Staphylococcus pseudintermedius]|uniref:FeoB small GTPase domain-containing protein n=1 Tax=Staphylococcus pseudintermedius TaxID=283734 RepID=UPI000E3B4249
TVQSLEYGAPMLIGMNMIDVSLKLGLPIDHQHLMRQLHISIIPVIARTGKWSDEVLIVLAVRHVSRQYSYKYMTPPTFLYC